MSIFLKKEKKKPIFSKEISYLIDLAVAVPLIGLVKKSRVFFNALKSRNWQKVK